jgi:hypothetical protein
MFIVTLVVLVIENKNKVLPQSSPYFIIGIIIVCIIIYTFWKIKPKTRDFFLKEYPGLILKKILKMDREERRKTLKKLKKTLPELKELARKY